MQRTSDEIEAAPRADGVFAPLRFPVFRRIWLASLLSNFGLLIQGVGAAWAMTELTADPQPVALVQTMLMAPMMLLSIPAGAAADVYDRRLVALAALLTSLFGAVGLSILSLTGHLAPWSLLGLCFFVGTGLAVFSPAWQASVPEQVPVESVPSAIAMNSISFNVARSFGPAVGGVLVAAAGAAAAFVANALCYLPMILVLFFWRRKPEPSRFPPESMGRAVLSGLRYVSHSPAILAVLGRTALAGVAGGVIPALMPLISRGLLQGGATTFGFLLGAYGIGAVLGALALARLRGRLSGEVLVRVSLVVFGAGTTVVALSPWFLLTAAGLVVGGASWMLAAAVFNVSVQLSAPRWVAARSLAAFQSSIAGGMALGGWAWGATAATAGVQAALLIAAATMVLVALVGLLIPIGTVGNAPTGLADELADPDVKLGLTGRSGPVAIEIEYRVDSDRARAFYNAMQAVQLTRKRNGAYAWSISRDVGDPELWTERYSFPTWMDYLRHRGRTTQTERELVVAAMDFHLGPDPVRVRRHLERPFGSVRWREDSPDSGVDPHMPPSGS